MTGAVVDAPRLMKPESTVLRLYVAGDAPNSTLARENLARLLERVDPADYRLEVIDCLRDPLRAIADGVLVTPTLLRVQPEPPRTVVGSLSAPERVAAVLDLKPSRQEGPAGDE